MKIGAGTLACHVAGFVWSIFMGITFVSMGLGAYLPAPQPGGQTIRLPEWANDL